MTLDDVLRELIGCLGARDDCVIGWEQTRRWPKGALDVFQKAGWLKLMAPATTVECQGCEENCFMPVQFSPAPAGQAAAPYVACETRSEMGKVKIPHARLQQWQITQSQIARWISTALHLRGKPEKDAASALFRLGNVQGKQRLAELHLDLNEPVSLKTSGHTLPLSEIMFIADGQPGIDGAAVLAMVNLPPATADNRYTPSNARREARKLDTQAMYESWQKEYRDLKKKHRNKSDVWCSQQIAKKDIANSRNAETIRKNMKK